MRTPEGKDARYIPHPCSDSHLVAAFFKQMQTQTREFEHQ
jgi:hypothetical protein